MHVVDVHDPIAVPASAIPEKDSSTIMATSKESRFFFFPYVCITPFCYSTIFVKSVVL